MDWDIPEDAVPSEFITDADLRTLIGKPPASGAWQEGDPIGNRQFLRTEHFTTETGGVLPKVQIAYETFGKLNERKDNAILVAHALTGDSHILGAAGPGHATAGWWEGVAGPGKAIDTDRWFVVVPNLLGGCQGTTGPASLAPDNNEWGSRFPYITIRDQTTLQRILMQQLGITQWFAVIGGSVGGMHVLEWAASYPDEVGRAAVIAAPAATTADNIAFNSLQISAITSDPGYRNGFYYEAKAGDGPHYGLSYARKLALFTYRGYSELNDRFGRSWQSAVSPLGDGGVYAVESYLDFHGNKFTRRFDANSYLTLVEAMNSHDIGRGRGGTQAALQAIETPMLVVGIDSDRLFPVQDQQFITRNIKNSITGTEPAIINSQYGHDAFLIETDEVGKHLSSLLEH